MTQRLPSRNAPLRDDATRDRGSRSRSRTLWRPRQHAPAPTPRQGLPSSWASTEGSAARFGATWIPTQQAYNFALFSSTATSVTLLFYAPEDLVSPCFSYRFDERRNKSGPVWHARIPHTSLGKARYYGYSVNGPADVAGAFHAFRPEKVLLDPYARAVYFPPQFSRQAAVGSGGNAGKAPLGVLQPDDEFDWSGGRRPHHDSDLIIYELHVGGFTKHPNSAVPAEHRGTFLGVVDKIPHLVRLGVTAVELMPVFQFDDTEPNYWGYMPINLFAPHHRYACGSGCGEQIREFKQMVKSLHQAGIEVFLDVVYNHTGEGNENGPTYSFRGIDNRAYYIPGLSPDHVYADFSGTGNTLNCAHRAVRQLVVDSLRYWAREMHVDGFRFDLASIFSRNSDGSINFEDPPIFGDIASDPALADVRMIAEPWEGNGQYPNYELGVEPVADKGCAHCPPSDAACCPSTSRLLQHSFPGLGWRQWNDRFRTTVRRFVRGDPDRVGDLMTRVYGSSDVFPDAPAEAYRAYQSLNYIASHDGLTLYDLVAYNSPESWNCGDRDGESGASAAVMALRKQQVKNFLCLLLLSNGTPMLRAGDELLRTQSGNANPYNIDSPITWIDWSRLDAHADVFRFFAALLGFHKHHPSLARSLFWRDDIHWYGLGPQVDWGAASHSLAWCLHGASQADADLYVLVNGFWEPLTFTLQEGAAADWKRIVDTSLPSPQDIVSEDAAEPLASLEYALAARAIAVFRRPAL